MRSFRRASAGAGGLRRPTPPPSPRSLEVFRGIYTSFLERGRRGGDEMNARDLRSIATAVATGATAVALLALLLLPLVHEGGVLNCPVQPSAGPATPIPTVPPCARTREITTPGAILIARAGQFGFGSSERDTEGVLLMLDVAVVAVALVTALALSFGRSRRASVGRAIALVLATLALVRLALTPFPASSAFHYYEGRNEGWAVALLATLVALIAALAAVGPWPERTP